MRHHPKRSELRSALGLAPDDLEVGEGTVDDAVQVGDVFLLCTDGLWEYVEDSMLCSSLLQASSPQAWLDGLAEEVLRNAAHK